MLRLALVEPCRLWWRPVQVGVGGRPRDWRRWASAYWRGASRYREGLLGGKRNAMYYGTRREEGGGLWTSLRHFLTRRQRPWRRDDIWALVSWLFVGQGLFILVGTTTCASVVLLLANSLQFQDWLARQVARRLAQQTGLSISFGQAISPDWLHGRIVFANVGVCTVGREDGEGEGEEGTRESKDENQGSNRRGKDSRDLSSTEYNSHSRDDSILSNAPSNLNNDGYTTYDLHIDRVEVTLSMARYLEGRGLVASLAMSGVRGIIDRRQIKEDAASREWRYHSQPGDFDLEQVSIRDALFTILSPNGFRPYRLSLISAQLPRLRKRCLLYDLMAAESIVGILDGSLFSMHIPQIVLNQSSTRCDSMRHLKMHALNVDFFSLGATSGPLSWLTRGSVDLDMFIQLPLNYRLTPASPITTLTENILVSILRQSGEGSFLSSSSSSPSPLSSLPSSSSSSSSSSFLSSPLYKIQQTYVDPFVDRLRSRLQNDFLNVDDSAFESAHEAAAYFMRAKPNTVSVKIDFRFHNLHAHLPWPPHSPNHHGYISTALMKPVVAYINEQRPFIPLSCHFEIGMDALDGAWTPYEAGMIEAVSKGVANSFELLVSDRQKRIRRLRKVSLWSLYALLRNLRLWVSESGGILHQPTIS